MFYFFPGVPQMVKINSGQTLLFQKSINLALYLWQNLSQEKKLPAETTTTIQIGMKLRWELKGLPTLQSRHWPVRGKGEQHLSRRVPFSYK